ncbi:aquaporin [Myroides odoratimimus]|uniref:aquaporin n=1 Tax=Myroides odoratimimus TaxID=76832 RepID=UPI0025757618|nr:aquaporin [Myroides odoratimimus]
MFALCDFAYSRGLNSKHIKIAMSNYFAEFFGTFWLVLGGCGSALFAAAVPDVGIGFMGVSLAFGLTVLTMAYAVGHISGGHFNPAVSVGMYMGGRFSAKEILPYIGSQILGAIAAAATLFLIFKGSQMCCIDPSLQEHSQLTVMETYLQWV